MSRRAQWGNHHPQNPYKKLRENFPNNPYPNNWQHPIARSRIVCNACGKFRHYVRECHTVKRCCHGSPQHQTRNYRLPHPQMSRDPEDPAPATHATQGWPNSTPKQPRSNSSTGSSEATQRTTLDPGGRVYVMRKE